MKKTTYPTFINLKDLQSRHLTEGEEFLYSRATGELNATLEDVIGKNDYIAKLRVQAIGNVFEISGDIKTQLEVPCARCGRDMKYPVNDKFHELIVVLEERPRAGHSGHTSGQLGEGPFCNYTSSHHFDLAEFVHEHIVAAEPYTPHCGADDCETYVSEPVPERSPFEVLKNLSAKTQRG
jgi:uncharacterized protein